MADNFGLQSLNDEQIKPVLHKDGALMVTAGAGSGKTRLLTHRIVHLIESGVKKNNILAITFTNKAAAEMRERLERMMPNISSIWIMTFHAMCVRILRNDIKELGYSPNFSIYSDTDKERVMKRLIKAMEIEQDDYLKPALDAIGALKNSNMTIEQYVQINAYNPKIKTLQQLLTQYETELKNSNSLDFDDLLTKVLELLIKVPAVLDKYQEKFKYIMVDEFQDTNEVQYAITKLLAAKHKNIFVVGDEDQSIYGWRGANFKNLLNITRDFDCTVYKLEQNYRSTKKILNAANNVIKNNKTRIDKTLWTQNEDGPRVEYYSGDDESEEAEYIASQIVALRSRYGYEYNDFAILIRVNALSRPFEERLLTYNIPHVVFGGIKFYERKEIKDITAYLKVVANAMDTESLLRIINYPKRGIGDAAIAQLRNYCAVSGVSLSNAILDINKNTDLPLALIKKFSSFSAMLRDFYDKKDMPLSAFVSYVLKKSGIVDMFNDDTDENINRRMNIDDFMSTVVDYEEKNEDASLEKYLQSITLYTDLDDMDDKNHAVNIATMHAAKGLEFKVVFAAGLDEGILPITRALDNPSDLEEERRLMYVAVTRARERLYITRAKSRFLYGARKYTMESRFVAETAPERKKVAPTQEYRQEPTYTPQFRREEIKRDAGVDFSRYKAGVRVRHSRFGEGTIVSILGNGVNTFAAIEFTGVGVKNIALAIAKLEVIG